MQIQLPINNFSIKYYVIVRCNSQNNQGFIRYYVIVRCNSQIIRALLETIRKSLRKNIVKSINNFLILIQKILNFSKVCIIKFKILLKVILLGSSCNKICSIFAILQEVIFIFRLKQFFTRVLFDENQKQRKS